MNSGLKHIWKSLLAVWIMLSMLVGWGTSPSARESKAPLRTITEEVHRPAPLTHYHALLKHLSNASHFTYPEAILQESIRIHSNLVSLKVKNSTLHNTNDFFNLENIHQRISLPSDDDASQA